MFGLVRANNLLFFASFPLAALAMVLWTCRLGLSWPAGILSGVFFSFSAYHLSRGLGHFSLADIHWLPLLAWTLTFDDCPPPFRRAALAGLFWAAAAGTHVYYLAFGLLWFVLASGIRLTRLAWACDSRGCIRHLGWSAATAGTMLLLFSPQLAAGWPGRAEYAEATAYSFLFSAHHGANLMSFIDPLFFLRDGWPSRIEQGLFLGFPALVLGAFGALKGKMRDRVLLLAGIAISFSLALGPSLHFDAAEWWASAGEWAPLPYRLMGMLPSFNPVRVPSRFGLVTLLVLSGLAGAGFDVLTRRMDKTRRWLAAGAILLAHCGQFAGARLPSHDRSPLPFAALIRDDPEPGAVLWLPLGLQSFRTGDALDAMHNQWTFERPVFSGVTSRYPKAVLRRFVEERFLSDVLALETGRFWRVSDLNVTAPAISSFVDRTQPRFLIVHRLLSPKANRLIGPYLARFFRLEEMYRDEDYLVFRLTRLGRRAAATSAVAP